MTDLIERLHELTKHDLGLHLLAKEAADEIGRLRAALEAVLDDIEAGDVDDDALRIELKNALDV